jgi:hypothetical protein
LKTQKSKTKKKSKTSKAKPKSKASYHLNLNSTEESLTGHLSEDLKDAWTKIRKFGVSLGTPRIYASHNSIMFSKKVCCFFVRPKKAFLEVWIFLPHEIEGLKSMQSSAKKIKFCNLFKLTHSDQVEEPLTTWLRESFSFIPEK